MATVAALVSWQAKGQLVIKGPWQKSRDEMVGEQIKENVVNAISTPKLETT